MFTDQVKDRLEGAVASLQHRTHGAADLAELIAQKALPQAPLTAYVISAGIRPIRGGESSAGAYTQELTEVIAVVLVVRTGNDVTGEKSVPKVDQLIEQVTKGIVGWMPDQTDESIYLPIGDFGFERGQLVRLDAGVLFYQLEFSCPLQLRIFG